MGDAYKVDLFDDMPSWKMPSWKLTRVSDGEEIFMTVANQKTRFWYVTLRFWLRNSTPSLPNETLLPKETHAFLKT